MTPESEVHLAAGDIDVLRADAERAMGLHAPAGEPVLWRGGCGFCVGPDLRLRFETPPSQWLSRLLLRSAYAAAVLVVSHITGRATRTAWVGTVGNVAAILVLGLSWLAECASIRRAGPTQRVEMYPLMLSRLVFVPSDIGGTQTWTLEKPDSSGIVPGRKGAPGTWICGRWCDPDGVRAHASMVLRGVDLAAAERIRRALTV